MRELWVALGESAPLEVKEALLEAVENSCSVILSDKADASLAESHGLRLASAEGGDILVIDESMIDAIETLPKPLCLRLIVRDRKDEEKAEKAADKGANYIAISCPDWKIIPLENLIARNRGSTKLLAEVSNAAEAKLALETLELGVDGIVLKTSDVSEVKSTLSILAELEGSEESSIRLVLAKVIGSRQLGMGARVCIDTCDIMASGEGMLVGSSSSGLFLVQAEVQENPHVEPRPFRVNAGPVSSYILVPGNGTRYLSELRAGDEALVVGRGGKSRRAIVGRVKIERRPLLMVEAEAEGDRVKVIVQNAETIRLMTRDGSKPVTELEQGDEVLVYHQRGGRHFGTLVEEETVIER